MNAARIPVPRSLGVLATRMLIASALTAFVAPNAHAQRDKYLPLVLQLPTNARMLSMGGAGVASTDADVVFRNPSLVGESAEMSLSLARYASPTHAGSFASGTKYGRFGMGFGVQYLDYTRDANSALTSSAALRIRGSTAASSLAATLAVTTAWKGIKWGVGAKYVEARASLAKDGSIAFDAGASKNLPFANLTASIAAQNLGPSLAMLGEEISLPSRVSLGVQGGGYSIGRWIDAGLVAQLGVRRDGVVLPAAGGELTYEPLEGFEFSLRAGARRPELREQRPMTAGVGFSLDRFSIDYAWEQLRASGAHRVTIRMH